jgi:hypothetical protein
MASRGSPDFISGTLFWADKPLASSGSVVFGRQQDKPIFGFDIIEGPVFINHNRASFLSGV